MSIRTERLTRDHENLGRLLLVLGSHAARVRTGEEPALLLMQGVVDYLIDWVEGEHDPVEQLVLARLERRARWLHALVLAHARELHEIRLSMVELSGLLARAQLDPLFDRDEVASAALALVTTIRRHALVEDAELLPAAEHALDGEDWRSIESALRTPGARAPTCGDERFETEFRELAAEAGCNCEYA